jgi:hypothetical protein
MLDYSSSILRLLDQGRDRFFAAASSGSGSASIPTAETSVQGSEDHSQAVEGNTVAGAGAANIGLTALPDANLEAAAVAAGTQLLSDSAEVDLVAADSEAAINVAHACAGDECAAADSGVADAYSSSAADMAALQEVQPPQALGVKSAVDLPGSPENQLASAAADAAATTIAVGSAANKSGLDAAPLEAALLDASQQQQHSGSVFKAETVVPTAAEAGAEAEAETQAEAEATIQPIWPPGVYLTPQMAQMLNEHGG